MSILSKYLRQITLWFYILLPHFALICVAIINANNSGWFYLTGWIMAFIFQIFFIAVNQSNQNHSLPLYKEAGALLLPILVLIKQLIFGGGIMLYIIELMALEVLVLIVGAIIAMIAGVKSDIRVAILGIVFFSGVLIASLLGLYSNWQQINTNQDLFSLIPLIVGLITGVLMYSKFLIALAQKEIALDDANFKNPVFFFVGQIVLWFMLIVITRHLYS